MRKAVTMLIAGCLVGFAAVSEARTVRATEMDAALWDSLGKGDLGDIVIEFRQGDELPVTLTAEGDLLETTQTAPSYVNIKRNFWLRVHQNKLQLSLDGANYNDFKDIVGGSIQLGVGGGSIANALNVALKAYLK